MNVEVPTSLEELKATAEDRWLAAWTEGPTEAEGFGLRRNAQAPSLTLHDHMGVERSLSEFWEEHLVLLMFWRHFGCSCGVDRAKRLRDEMAEYEDAGLRPVIVTQGEPARAAEYRKRHGLVCPVLCDPDHRAYRAYGVGHWSVERVLYDAPPEYWGHPRELGLSFLETRREAGRPPVDDPWRATAEFVVGPDGLVRLCYLYQHCEDFPDPRVLTTAARLG